MAGINIVRVVLGGIVAGVVINIFEGVLNGWYLADQWTEVMASINKADPGDDAIIWFNVIGFVIGLVAVWSYAAMRPRFGAGVKTAVYAAIPVWITAYVIANAFMVIMGIEPLSLFYILVGVGFVEIVAATIAGAYFYKEAA